MATVALEQQSARSPERMAAEDSEILLARGSPQDRHPGRDAIPARADGKDYSKVRSRCPDQLETGQA
jgi:hypothetical protein